MAKSEKRRKIEAMQRDLRVSNLQNKCCQFDIRILELQEEIDRLMHNRKLCEEEIEKILTPIEE